MVSPSATSMRRFAGGLQLHTTDLDDINLDDAGNPPKRPAPPPPPLPHATPESSMAYLPSTPSIPAARGATSVPSGPAWVTSPLSSSRAQAPPHPLSSSSSAPPPPPPYPPPPLTHHPMPTHFEERTDNHNYQPGGPGESLLDWEMKHYKARSFSLGSSHAGEQQTYLSSPKVQCAVKYTLHLWHAQHPVTDLEVIKKEKM